MPLLLASDLSRSAAVLAARAPHAKKALVVADADPDRAPTQRPTCHALAEHGILLECVQVAAMTDPAEFATRLAVADLLVVDDGNAFLLAQAARAEMRSLMWWFVVGRGGWYTGSGVGSVFAAPDIAYIAEADEPARATRLTSTAGLCLAPLGVVPHHGDDRRRPISPVARAAAGFELIDLADGQALVADPDGIQVV